MNPDSGQQSETPRLTIPKHVLDRIEREWQQMRNHAVPIPTASDLQNDRR